jgi:hypothetical protein
LGLYNQTKKLIPENQAMADHATPGTRFVHGAYSVQRGWFCLQLGDTSLKAPVKVGSSIIHKCMRQKEDEKIPWIFREVSTAIHAADGKGNGVLTNLINRFACALVEDGPVVLMHNQPKFLDSLFEDLVGMAVCNTPDNPARFETCRILVGRITWNLKRCTQRVRYLSLATMLVRMNKLEHKLQDPRYAELQQRLQQPALQLAWEKGCKRIDELKRLCPGLAKLMQKTKCKKNRELNRLCEILTAVRKLLPSVFDDDTVVYDKECSLGPQAMTQKDFERLGIMDQHVVPGEKGRSVWKRVSNKVRGAETNPPLFGFAYLDLENMYEDEDRSASTAAKSACGKRSLAPATPAVAFESAGKDEDRSASTSAQARPAKGRKVAKGGARSLGVQRFPPPAKPAGVLEKLSALFQLCDDSYPFGFKPCTTVARHKNGTLTHLKSKQDMRTVMMTIKALGVMDALGFTVPEAEAVWVTDEAAFWQKVTEHPQSNPNWQGWYKHWLKDDGKEMLALVTTYVGGRTMQNVTDADYRAHMPDVASLLVGLVVSKYMGAGDINQKNIVVTPHGFVRFDSCYVDPDTIVHEFNARGLQTSQPMCFPDALKRAIEAYIQASYAALAGYIERLLTEHADVRHPLVRYRLFDDAEQLARLREGSTEACRALYNDVVLTPAKFRSLATAQAQS